LAAATTMFAEKAMIKLRRMAALRLGRMLASEWRNPRRWRLVPILGGPEAGPPFTAAVLTFSAGTQAPLPWPSI
jgi:hypothetical protein